MKALVYHVGNLAPSILRIIGNNFWSLSRGVIRPKFCLRIENNPMEDVENELEGPKQGGSCSHQDDG